MASEDTQIDPDMTKDRTPKVPTDTTPDPDMTIPTTLETAADTEGSEISTIRQKLSELEIFNGVGTRRRLDELKVLKPSKRTDAGIPDPDVLKKLAEENKKPYQQRRRERASHLMRHVKNTVNPTCITKYGDKLPEMNTPQQCPLDPDHCYTLGQYGPKHLTYCRKNTKKLVRMEFDVCEFNIAHYVRKGHMKNHLDSCLYYQRWVYRQVLAGLPFTIAEDLADANFKFNQKQLKKKNATENSPKSPYQEIDKLTNIKKYNKGNSYNWDDDC